MADRAGARRLDRRSFLRVAGAAGTAVAAGGAAAACGSGLPDADSGPSGDTIRIGHVSPGTGVLAQFGEADDFVIDSVREHFSRNPLRVGGQDHPVEILKRDSQSDPDRAADVAADLIENAGVHLMLVSSTPDTVNPVSDRCEAKEMPCISTFAPWQPWFHGRGGTEGSRFTWTYNFFGGLEDVAAVYADMWDGVATGKRAGALWPTDADGLAWSDPTAGFAPAQTQRGYQIIDPGNYPNGTRDFSAQIAAFRDGGAEILLGVPTAPDFTTFLRQAAQVGYQPGLVTVAKALLFPSDVEALGPLGVNLGTEVWWSPGHPFTSSLTGQTAAQLADAYTQATGRQWTQPIGFAHALFEVAAEAFSSVRSVDDRQGLAAAIDRMRLDTVVGPLDWTAGPMPNVARTPVVGGQWRPGTVTAYDLVVVSNGQAPGIPAGGRVEPLPAAGPRSGDGAGP